MLKSNEFYIFENSDTCWLFKKKPNKYCNSKKYSAHGYSHFVCSREFQILTKIKLKRNKLYILEINIKELE